MNRFNPNKSREERRKYLLELNHIRRTWVHGKSNLLADVPVKEAAKLYRQNWDGCRELWVEHYRQRKARRL